MMNQALVEAAREAREINIIWHKSECVLALQRACIAYDDAVQLRRISMTLHRWHELECGDGNDHGSWCIARGEKRCHPDGSQVFYHDDDGKPYLEHHHYLHGCGQDYVSYSLLPDRERGALKRLDKIMKRYFSWIAYIQGDPRGASLYLLRKSDVPEGADVSAYYSRGLAVYK